MVIVRLRMLIVLGRVGDLNRSLEVGRQEQCLGEAYLTSVAETVSFLMRVYTMAKMLVSIKVR